MPFANASSRVVLLELPARWFLISLNTLFRLCGATRSSRLYMPMSPTLSPMRGMSGMSAYSTLPPLARFRIAAKPSPLNQTPISACDMLR